MYYVNKKGVRIELTLTKHAIDSFKSRYYALFEKDPVNIEEYLNSLFSGANRVANLNKHELNRLKRYGTDTMFFRNGDFTFVVQNSAVKTIEISRQGFRYLNKKRGR